MIPLNFLSLPDAPLDLEIRTFETDCDAEIAELEALAETFSSDKEKLLLKQELQRVKSGLVREVCALRWKVGVPYQEICKKLLAQLKTSYEASAARDRTFVAGQQRIKEALKGATCSGPFQKLAFPTGGSAPSLAHLLQKCYPKPTHPFYEHLREFEEFPRDLSIEKEVVEEGMAAARNLALSLEVTGAVLIGEALLTGAVWPLAVALAAVSASVVAIKYAADKMLPESFKEAIAKAPENLAANYGVSEESGRQFMQDLESISMMAAFPAALQGAKKCLSLVHRAKGELVSLDRHGGSVIYAKKESFDSAQYIPFHRANDSNLYVIIAEGDASSGSFAKAEPWLRQLAKTLDKDNVLVWAESRNIRAELLPKLSVLPKNERIFSMKLFEVEFGPFTDAAFQESSGGSAAVAIATDLLKIAGEIKQTGNPQFGEIYRVLRQINHHLPKGRIEEIPSQNRLFGLFDQIFSQEAPGFKAVREKFAAEIFQEAKGASFQWFSEQAIATYLLGEGATPNAYTRAAFFHATTKEGLEGILKSRLIQETVYPGFRKGARIQPVVDDLFGEYVIVLNRSVSYLFPPRPYNERDVYNLVGEIPVTADTLECIAVKDLAERLRLEELASRWAGRPIQVVSYDELNQLHQRRVQLTGKLIPGLWDLPERIRSVPLRPNPIFVPTFAERLQRLAIPKKVLEVPQMFKEVFSGRAATVAGDLVEVAYEIIQTKNPQLGKLQEIMRQITHHIPKGRVDEIPLQNQLLGLFDHIFSKDFPGFDKVRERFASRLFQRTDEGPVRWYSDQEIATHLFGEGLGPTIASKATFFHATQIEGVEGVLKAGEIRWDPANFASLPGPWLSEQPLAEEYGGYVFVFNRSISYVRNLRDLESREENSYSFTGALPVNADTLECIATVSGNRKALAKQFSNWAGREIKVVDLFGLEDELDKRLAFTGRLAPAIWNIPQWIGKNGEASRTFFGAKMDS